MQISITNALAQATLRRIFTNYDPSSQIGNYTFGSDLWSYALEHTYEYRQFIQSETTFAQIASNNDAVGGPLTANMNYSNLRLMKGTVPTDFTGLTQYSSRSADVLVTWGVGDISNWSISGNTITGGYTNLVQAAQGGVATWLWWSNSVIDSDLLTYGHQIVFTVGGTGSGADFELLNTTIISGNNYKIINGPRFSLATEYNY